MFEDMYIIVRSLRMGISNANRMFANKCSESAVKKQDWLLKGLKSARE